MSDTERMAKFLRRLDKQIQQSHARFNLICERYNVTHKRWFGIGLPSHTVVSGRIQRLDRSIMESELSRRIIEDVKNPRDERVTSASMDAYFVCRDLNNLANLLDEDVIECHRVNV